VVDDGWYYLLFLVISLRGENNKKKIEMNYIQELEIVNGTRMIFKSSKH
jgi:hypothetical protein